MINIDKYWNDGWGLSKLEFEKIQEIIINKNKEKIRILEFGSGTSTRFLVDLVLTMNSNIEITSFDNDPQYMYNGDKHDFLKLNLRELVECDDESFNQMFLNQKYNSEVMYSKKSPLSTRQRNNFYNIRNGDLEGIYDLVILDGPNGNGRSLSFLHLINHLENGSIILIDDSTHYDFFDKASEIFNLEVIFKHIGGIRNKWLNGGDFIIAKVK